MRITLGPQEREKVRRYLAEELWNMHHIGKPRDCSSLWGAPKEEQDRYLVDAGLLVPAVERFLEEER